MAQFKSIVTNVGVARLSSIVALGKKLTITRVMIGAGRSADPAGATGLISKVAADVTMGEMTTGIDSEGNSLMYLPIAVSNLNQTKPLPIREIAVMARDDEGEFCFVYSYLYGPDSDNIIPVSLTPGTVDTRHEQDIAILLTNQEAAVITVEVSTTAAVSESRLKQYAAPLIHRHSASEIDESTGENTEIVQRRQDTDIAALKEQLDTGFTGTTVVHTFKMNELELWKGWDGTGYPLGIYDAANARLYA